MIRIIILALLISFNQSYSLAETDSASRIADRLEKMEKDLTSLQRQFYREKPADGAPNLARVGGSNIAEIDARMGDIEEKLRNLNGNIEQLQYESKKQQQLLSEIIEKQNTKQIKEETPAPKEKKPEAKKEKPQTVTDEPKVLGKVKIQNIHDEDTIVEKDQTPAAKETKTKEETAQGLFDKSFAHLRASELDDARVGFEKFIEKHKGHELTGNAYYWLGETYFIEKEYKQAGANFVKSYKEAPKGPKAYESLIKLATSFSHLDKQKEACSVINKLNGFEASLSNNLKTRIKEEASRIGCK